VGHGRVFAPDIPATVDEEAVAEVDFQLVARIAHLGDVDAVGHDPKAHADRGAVGEEGHRLAHQSEAQRLHRDVAVHFGPHAEVAPGDDDVPGPATLVKPRVGLREQVRYQVLRVDVAPRDQPVGNDTAGVRHVVAQLVAAAL